MNEDSTNKELIINLLLASSIQEESQVGYYSLEKETYQQIFSLLINLVKEGDTEFIFDLKNTFQNLDFEPFKQKEIIEEYRFVRQSGSDIYSYIKLKAEAVAEPLLIVKEELSEILGELIGENLPKNQCSEWMQVYPYILKALLDHCVKNKMIGLKFTLLEVRFHPIDYKPYAYYVCARKLLNKIEMSS